MPSKGIQLYSYNAVPNCQIEFSVPKQSVIVTAQKQFSTHHLEVDSTNIPGAFGYTGTFRFRVTQNGSELISRFIQINALTGNMNQGNMKKMEDQDTVMVNDNQCYVTVTPNYSHWMQSVAVQGSPRAKKPFTRFVLPAAHDIGMNSMQHCDAILSRSTQVLLDLMNIHIPIFADIGRQTTDRIVAGLAGPIIESLSITQKDSLTTILSIGARYFEFRPAYLHNSLRHAQPIPDVLYFHHGPIPGMSYEEFLCGCIEFLLKNLGEIIVIQLRWDRVPAQCERPSNEDLITYLDEAIAPAHGGLLIGDLYDMLHCSIDELRLCRKRLIMLENSDSFSTYTDCGNATLNGDSIIAELEATTSTIQEGKSFTNLQCQATATNIPEAAAYSSLTANVSNSCLLATKAICDHQTMPWIQRNALKRLGNDHLILIMDDFVDGGMCDLARDLSIERLSQD